MTPMRWLTADELEILDLGARAEEAATITFHGNQLRILLAGYRAAKGLRDALERALMQWEMHADNLRYGGVDEPYLADGQDPEAELYREARALLAAPGAAPAEGRALDVDRLAAADGYRQGWAAACETVLREVEDLPDRSGLGDASLSRGAVVGIVRDALSTLE